MCILHKDIYDKTEMARRETQHLQIQLFKQQPWLMLTLLSLANISSLYPGRMSSLRLTSSRAMSTAGRQPLPPAQPPVIGKIPPMYKVLFLLGWATYTWWSGRECLVSRVQDATFNEEIIARVTRKTRSLQFSDRGSIVPVCSLLQCTQYRRINLAICL